MLIIFFKLCIHNGVIFYETNINVSQNSYIKHKTKMKSHGKFDDNLVQIFMTKNNNTFLRFFQSLIDFKVKLIGIIFH